MVIYMKKYLLVVFLIIILFVITPITKSNNINAITYYTSNQMDDAREVIVKSIFDNNDLDINRMEIKNEEDFITYMKGIFEEVKNIVSKDNITKDDKDILKKTFVDVVDFIFYNKEIKGYKFKDLSISTKKDILKVFIDIDNKIESKYPNYKKNIESASKKQYNNTRDKMDKMLDKYKEQIKTESYNYAKRESKNIFIRINNAINRWIKKVSE